jgi:hypothetical protein
MSILSFFQLVFDNYSKAAGPSSASPATSYSERTPAEVFVDDFSHANSMKEELAELRQ